MNEETPPPPPPPLPPKQNKALKVWLGALVGIIPGVAALLMGGKSDGIVGVFFLSISLWPLAAIILAVIRSTRRFGLGMLLGVGFDWIVLVSVCGGATIPMH